MTTVNSEIPSGGSQDTVLKDLRETLGRAIEILADLDSHRTSALDSGTDLAQKAEEYRQELEAERIDRAVLTEQLIEAERQATRIMSLYVATHQLHSTLDLQAVYSAVGEIATDLLGARSFVLLMKEGEQESRIALKRGIDGEHKTLFEGGTYSSGHPRIDQALEDGILYIADDDAQDAMAVVPLRVEGGHVGVLAIFEVFAHRTASLGQDRDLLDLLSVHAGSALVAAESYSKTDRKLKTLKDLVGLLPAP